MINDYDSICIYKTNTQIKVILYDECCLIIQYNITYIAYSTYTNYNGIINTQKMF